MAREIWLLALRTIQDQDEDGKPVTIRANSRFRTADAKKAKALVKKKAARYVESAPSEDGLGGVVDEDEAEVDGDEDADEGDDGLGGDAEVVKPAKAAKPGKAKKSK
jgi:hypothetical protein